MIRRIPLVLALILILFLLLSLIFGVLYFRERTTFFGQATVPIVGEVSTENSYIFASPLSAQVETKEKIRLTIFVLDSQGRGVNGETVSLGQDARLETTPIQPTTDSLGRAIFDISSASQGEYFIEARVGNKILPQRVKLSFR